jgi:hypothetical protein
VGFVAAGSSFEISPKTHGEPVFPVKQSWLKEERRCQSGKLSRFGTALVYCGYLWNLKK